MKKVMYLLTAFSFVAVSCSKEGFEPMDNDPTVDEGRLTVVTGADLDGGIVPMNETFTLSGKAAALSYTYKVYAESPIVNGLQTAATSVAASGNFVFVSWHTEGAPVGGAISAYEFNGTDYSYVARVDFDDSDWHDIAVSTSGSDVTIYMAGQRNPDSSGYLLSTHKGAVVGKLVFNDGGATKFDIANYEEIPLPSYGANGVVLQGSNAVITTGNGTGSSSNTGGVYQINTTFDFVDAAYEDADFTDGEFLTIANSEIYALDREGSSNVELHNASSVAGLVSGAAKIEAAVSTLDNERNALSDYSTTSNSGVLAALGTNGIYHAPYALGSFSQVASLGSAALGVSHDAGNELIYVAAGGGGMHVLADEDYATGKALISEFDLVGKFIAPTNAPFNSNFVCKDVNVYNTSEIAIASGNGGMFFVEQND